MAETFNLEMEMLSQDEIDAIWKTNNKRATNFSDFQTALNKRDVGDGWSIPVGKLAEAAGKDNAEYTKGVRYNFNEAAAHRTITKVVDGVETEESAPVRIQWKTVQHEVEQDVLDAKGKKVGVTKVNVIDHLKVYLVASEVRHRARAEREEVTVENPPADAKKGTIVTLADGRKARMTKDGKWMATKPKVAEESANGVVENAPAPAPAAA
jgi:hypothetical protein